MLGRCHLKGADFNHEDTARRPSCRVCAAWNKGLTLLGLGMHNDVFLLSSILTVCLGGYP